MFGELGWISCDYEQHSTVKLLKDERCDIDLYQGKKSHPLYIACQNRHDKTVQLLLINEANVNLCRKDVAGPLFYSLSKRTW